ncbi:MAG: amino acid ABC transporter substrate-binding protein [Eggerthellaceae bacterium]|nr:amino acid ABC transporter substrate-binding protein [Eggerthellaceae bacterium]
MKARKYIVLAAMAVMVAALALVGCSSGSASSASKSASASSASASASASASSASASSSAASGSMQLITAGKLTIATSPDYPPFENLENGEYVGLDIEIAKAVAKELGLTPEFKTLQFDAIIPAIAAGGQADMGISGFSIDPDRAKEIDFSSSYYIDDQAVAVMNDSPITAENADAELNKDGVIIAVQSGTTGETYVQENYPKATVQAYGNSTDAFAAMQSGQANAVCTNKAVVDTRLADAYKDARVVKTIATGEEYAIVISKDNKALTTAVNDALAKIASDGTLDTLIKQYM